jgi:hypothetical protein
MKNSHLLPALPLLALLTPAAWTQATLTVIQGSGAATCVSSDGAVVGLASVALWTPVGGEVPLTGGESLVGLNFNGTRAAGDVQVGADDFIGQWNGVTWSALPAFAGSFGCGNEFGSTYDMSGSGDVVVGLGWDNCKGRAYRYDPVNGAVKLKEGDFNGNRANCVSFDGQVVAGWDQNLSGQRRPARWFTATQVQILATAGEVFDLSADGSVAVGYSGTGDNRFATVWRPNLPALLLPKLPAVPSTLPHYANATDGAGLTVGGQSGGFFDGIQIAFYYREDVGTVELETLLAELGAPNLSGSVLQAVRGMSLDGRTLVGAGDSLGFGLSPDAFVATLPDAWLRTNTTTISASTGGSQVLTLNAGPERGNDIYFLLGSSSGTTPGFNLDGFNLPLNIDTYTNFTLTSPNTFITNSLGLFDGLGRATATLNVPAGLNPSAIGLTLSHAYFVMDNGTFTVVETSMPAQVTITP